MADEQEQAPEAPQEEAARKSGLAEQWQHLATWQKAGVIIGAGALVVAVLIFINSQQQPTPTGNDQNMQPAGSNPGTVPGSGDQFPPVPVPPASVPPSPPVASGPPFKSGPPPHQINPPKTRGGKTYTVRAGDTLSGIAQSHGETWSQLYAKNKGIIDTTARQHGKTSNFQNWIFGGEKLQL